MLRGTGASAGARRCRSFLRPSPPALRWLAVACIAGAVLPCGRCDLPVHCVIEHVYGVWYV